MSGLSLRTVQRLEAGHRVSYASLRALAATFEIDVDALERELYAMNKSTDDFVEIPRWVRLMNDWLWYGGRRPSRRVAHILEAIIMGCAILFFAASFLVSSEVTATIFRLAALFNLVIGCLLSVASRIIDTYRLWPIAGGATSEPEQPHRTLRTRAIEYTFAFSVALLFIVMVCWLAF